MALGWCSGDRTMADMAICCLAVAGVDGCGWSVALRWAAVETPATKPFSCLSHLVRQTKKVTHGCFSRTQDQKGSCCANFVTQRRLKNPQTGDTLNQSWPVSWGMVFGLLCSFEAESSYLPPAQTGVQCGSSEGLLPAPRSALSPFPGLASAHCTAEEPVWAKQGPLSVD